jgi:hypothetical protein
MTAFAVEALDRNSVRVRFPPARGGGGLPRMRGRGLF